MSGEQAEERTARPAMMSWRGGDLVPINSEGMRTVIDECSRLASRNEQLVKEATSYAEVISYISEIVNGTPECHYLVIADDVQRMRDRLASRVEELEKGLREIGKVTNWEDVDEIVLRLLAGAHAEEKPKCIE